MGIKTIILHCIHLSLQTRAFCCSAVFTHALQMFTMSNLSVKGSFLEFYLKLDCVLRNRVHFIVLLAKRQPKSTQPPILLSKGFIFQVKTSVQ